MKDTAILTHRMRINLSPEGIQFIQVFDGWGELHLFQDPTFS